MSKRKARSPGITEMNFVSSLPLEEAVRLIGGLAMPQTPVTLTEIDEDSFRFEIRFQRQHETLAAVKGTLRRWQGTFTRLDCSSEVKERLPWTVLLPGLFFFASLLLLPIIQTIVPEKIQAQGFEINLGNEGDGALIVLSLINAPFLIVFSILTSRRRDEHSSAKDAGEMLNHLINAFKAAGEVSLDGNRVDDRDDAGVDAALDVLDTQEIQRLQRKT